MLAATDEQLPKVSLSRSQRLWLILVGLFVAIVFARIAPDVVRLFVPLGIFEYATDYNAVVVRVPAHVPKGTDPIQLGDRVRIDRITPFDRKPGIAGNGYTRENFDRRLPIERRGKERILRLKAYPEPVGARIFTVVRILVFIASISLGAILVLIKPGYATAGFFAFCIGGEFPATYFDQIFDPPWTEIPQWIGHTIQGASGAALLLFAILLIDSDGKRERTYAIAAGVVGLALGTLHAYAFWLLHYGARPAGGFESAFTFISNVLTVATGCAFLYAYLRARGRVNRQRAGWIGGSFALAGIAHLAAQQLYPRYLPFWANGVLVSMTIVPIVVVWIAVVRHRFFNVDFVVSRAMVYVAVTAGFVGLVFTLEEVGTYIFSQNTDLAYGFVIVICSIVAAFTGKINGFLRVFVDRFVFHDRHVQQKALELIAGYILDAETLDDVYRALLQDAPHALQLAFGGILARQSDGSYQLSQSHNWPDDCVVQLHSEDALTRAISQTRGALTFSGKDTALIRDAFPNERLTFAAPIFFDRNVAAIVVYGHSISGLDLDPHERLLLVRVVAHASIALNSIELARYRMERDGTTDPLPLPITSS